MVRVGVSPYKKIINIRYSLKMLYDFLKYVSHHVDKLLDIFYACITILLSSECTAVVSEAH